MLKRRARCHLPTGPPADVPALMESILTETFENPISRLEGLWIELAVRIVDWDYFWETLDLPGRDRVIGRLARHGFEC